MRLRSLILVSLPALGCGTEASIRRPGLADAAVPACALTVDGPVVLALLPSERRELTLRAVGQNVGELRVGLVGSARDASLDRTVVLPDANGAARISLTAPSSAAAFRVRVTAGCGAEVFVDARVDTDGVGAVDVASVYRGTRGPTTITVDLLRGDDCDPTGTATVAGTATIPAPGGSVRFGGLVTGMAYSLRGTALGRDRLPVADACAGPVRVREGEARSVALAFADRASVLGARYDLAVTFDLSEAAARTAAQWVEAVRTELATIGGESRLFAAEFAEAAAASVPPELAPATRAMVFTAFNGPLANQLEGALARRGVRVEAALQRLADPTAAGLARARMSATALRPSVEGALWSLQNLAVRLDPGTPDVDGDDANVPLGDDASARLGRSGADNIVASLVGLPVPYARLARRSLGAVTERFGVASTGEYVALGACPVVAAVLAPIAARCDESCRLAACRRSVERVGRAFDEAVARTDLARASVDLRFAAVGRVAPGTLRIERIESLAAGSFREEPETPVLAAVALTAAAP